MSDLGVWAPFVPLGVGVLAVYLVARIFTRRNGVLASLTALEQLGLIERRGSRYQPVEVTGKKDLSSAPVLRRLAEGEG